MHICDFVDQFTLCCSGWLLAVFFSSNQSGSCRKNAFLSSSKSKIANESRHSFLSELLIYLSRSTSNHQSNQVRNQCQTTEHTGAQWQNVQPMSSKLVPLLFLLPTSVIFSLRFGLCHRGLKLDDRSAAASTTGPDRSSKANANLR